MASGYRGGDRRGSRRRRKLRTGLAVALFVVALALVGVVAWLAFGTPGASPHQVAAERAHREGRLDEAIAGYRQLLVEDPANHQARWRLGQACLARNDLHAAVAAFRAVHAAVPGSRSALALAESLLRAGSTEEARGVLRNWLAFRSEDVEVRRALASVELDAGHASAALHELELVLDAAPDDVMTLTTLAWLYDDAGDQRALVLAERARQLQPDAAGVADTLGWLLVRRGELQRGMQLLEQAHGAAPAEPAVAYHFAYALARAGDSSRAAAVLRELLAGTAVHEVRDEAQRLLLELGGS